MTKKGAKDDEPIVFVGMRVSDLPVPHVPSVERRCGTCDEAIWVGRDGLQMAIKAERLVCVPCISIELELEATGSIVYH